MAKIGTISKKMFGVCLWPSFRLQLVSDVIATELMRVEEPLRRCWDAKKFGAVARSTPTPLGFEDETKRLGNQ